MLTQDIIKALKGYTANMKNAVTFVVKTGEHEKRDELLQFLKEIAQVSDQIIVEERPCDVLRSSMSFLLETHGIDTGIRFSGIPSSHEFNSLILALLQASGTPLKLDYSLQKMVANVKEKLHFEVFISLNCHNCPDVVQLLNQFALINANINVEMIDGALFQNMISQRNIQGVPSVYLNGELFFHGKVTASEFIEKLIERDASIVALGNISDPLPLQDVVVIGSGPAGSSAAIYSARKGLKVTVISERIGGQLKETLDIENMISVLKTTGAQLSHDLQSHMNEYDITIKEHLKVTNVEQGAIKKITLTSGEILHAKTVIIATGAKWRKLGIPGELDNIGRGVAYCPHCDGPFFKGKDVAVIGGGNSGMEAALDLAGIVQSVQVFEFLPELKADKVLIDKAQARNNIIIRKNVATKSILATDGKVSGIEYVDRETAEEKVLNLQGVFVQIGLVPNSEFLDGVVECTRSGEIWVNEKCETSEKGIYACGDVTTVPYKQIVISMGEGAKASLSASEYLLTNGSWWEDRALCG